MTYLDPLFPIKLHIQMFLLLIIL